MLTRLFAFSMLSLFIASCSTANSNGNTSQSFEGTSSSKDSNAINLTRDDGSVQYNGAAWLGDYASVQILQEQAELYVETTKYLEAARLYEKAAKIGEGLPSKSGLPLYLNTAEYYIKVGENGRALKALRRAAEKGARWANYVETAEKFSALRGNESFHSLISELQNNHVDYKKSYANPDETPLVFSDVEKFWEAFDLAVNEGNSAKQAAIFRHYYLAQGSPGLIDYHWIKTGTAEQLVERVNEIPEFYNGIREQTLIAETYEIEIRNGFRRFKTVYPEAYFPPVTFVIGRLNSGGTAGEEGMLIGLDVWSWTEGVPLDGISKGFQKVLQSFSLESLPWVVVHEQVHAMQSYSGEPSLLLSVLQEGSADFLAKLALPEQSNPPYYEWGLQHETRIWARFVEEMDGDDLSNWIGNNSSDISADWHADVGYFLGARIAEAYYKQAEDKEQAVRDLLYVKNPHNVLVASGYAEKFR